MIAPKLPATAFAKSSPKAADSRLLASNKTPPHGEALALAYRGTRVHARRASWKPLHEETETDLFGEQAYSVAA